MELGLTLSVRPTTTTNNVTNTTMQVAHDWNKSGMNYMTCSFYGQSTNLTRYHHLTKSSFKWCHR